MPVAFEVSFGISRFETLVSRLGRISCECLSLLFCSARYSVAILTKALLIINASTQRYSSFVRLCSAVVQVRKTAAYILAGKVQSTVLVSNINV